MKHYNELDTIDKEIRKELQIEYERQIMIEMGILSESEEHPEKIN